jgi:hypothetical protein
MKKLGKFRLDLSGSKPNQLARCREHGSDISRCITGGISCLAARVLTFEEAFQSTEIVPVYGVLS